MHQSNSRENVVELAVVILDMDAKELMNQKLIGW